MLSLDEKNFLNIFTSQVFRMCVVRCDSHHIFMLVKRKNVIKLKF